MDSKADNKDPSLPQRPHNLDVDQLANVLAPMLPFKTVETPDDDDDDEALRQFCELPDFPYDQHYKVEERLGEGGCGVVLRVTELASGKPFAAKFACRTDQTLPNEHDVLRKLEAASVSLVVPQVHWLRRVGFQRCLLMSLCGKSMSALRESVPRRQLSLASVCRIGIGMVRQADIVFTISVPIFTCTGSYSAIDSQRECGSLRSVSWQHLSELAGSRSVEPWFGTLPHRLRRWQRMAEFD